MSRGRRDRRDQPDASGSDSRESRRSRRPGGPDDEWQPGSRAVVDGWPSARGDYGAGSGANQGGYSGSGSYQGTDDGHSGSYPGQGGYADNGYGNGAYGGAGRPDDPYASSGYGGYRGDEYSDPSYGRGQTSGSGYPGGHSGGFAQPDPYTGADPYAGRDSGASGPYGRPDSRGATDPRGLTDPFGRTDPGRHADPRGTSGSHGGALEPYRGGGAGYSGAGYGGAGYDSAGYDGAGGGASYSGAGYDNAGYDNAGYDRPGYDRPGYDGGGHEQQSYGALEPYRGGAGYSGGGYGGADYNGADYNSSGYNSAGYNGAGYDSAGYNGAGYEDAGYNGAGYNGAGYDRAGYAGGGHEGDSGGWAGQGERGYASQDAYDDAAGYGSHGGPAAGYAHGGGYDERGYEPGWGAGQQDQYPAGENSYDPGSYPGEQNYPGDPDPLADSGLGSAVGRGSRNDWQAQPDDVGMMRRRNRAEDEIDADDARHNNFFRGFGRGDDDYTHRPPKKRRRSRAGMVALCVIVLFLAGIVGGGIYGYKWYAKRHADFSGPVGGPVMVQVKPGDIACGATLENTLVNDGIVASATAFCDAAKTAGNSAALEPGFFRLRKHMSGKAAWTLLVNPKSRVQSNVAVPDGLRVSRVLALVAQQTGIPLSQFQLVLKNDVSKLGLPSWAKGNPEGFLYPATYPVQPGATALEILKTMVAKFNSEISTINLLREAKAGRFTEYQVIKEASLLEAEVGSVPQYFGKVAGVIDNRLNQHWYLGLNSTVAYALNKYTYNFTNSQLHSPSPYNTMNHYGLPPGPIDSPDIQAIKAVLHPTQTTAMYFITVNKAGKTLFTSSASQFNAWSQEAVKHGI